MRATLWTARDLSPLFPVGTCHDEGRLRRARIGKCTGWPLGRQGWRHVAGSKAV